MNEYLELTRQAALIIVGHGSTLNPDSSAPTYQHADEIKRRGIFREVVCCFWKEEPSMYEAFLMVESDLIFIVPNFISEGYFCQQVLPRELRLDGVVTQRGKKTIYYGDPVGIHRNMTKLLLQRYHEVAVGLDAAKTSVIIVGHGTSLNDHSTQAIKDQVRLIQESGVGLGEVVDAYMGQEPMVSKWDEMTRCENVVVIPFFIADGLHSYQDIPVLLGMVEEVGNALSQEEVFRNNPIELRGRKLYYSRAIGTEAMMSEVIVDQVVECIQKYQVKIETAEIKKERLQFLSEALVGGRLSIGQVKVQKNEKGYHLFHREDEGKSLKKIETIEEMRQRLRFDENGKFRPLKSGPNMLGGWIIEAEDVAAVDQWLDVLYPAAVAMAYEASRGTLKAVSLRETLGRQTGMYQFANGIEDDQAAEMITKTCASDKKCLRRVCYQLTAEEELGAAAKVKTDVTVGVIDPEEHSLPLLCVEACAHVVGAARRISKANFDAKNSS